MHSPRTLRNILSQAMNPARFSVILNKVIKRIFDGTGRHTKAENVSWLIANCSDYATLAASVNEPLWTEAQLLAKELERHAATVLKDIPHTLGGGGIYPFLYFLARHIKPHCVVETGVGAGFSSYALLSALQANGQGALYSSDFPYFRIQDPEQYIGAVVKNSLRDRWHLYIDGDEKNLPVIAKQVEQVDIFHYDSDKSYSGRAYAVSQIQDLLGPDSILLMDDIQDNSFFRDYVEKFRPAAWYVFRFQNKYVGMVGQITP